MKATLGWAFLRRSTPELSTPSPQTGDSKAIEAALVAQLTTLLLPNRIQISPGFLPFSEWPVVFWKVSPITNPRAVIILAGEGPRLRNVVLRRGNCTGSFWETFPSPSARRPDRQELLLSASRCCHKAVAPVAPSEDEADRLGWSWPGWDHGAASHPCRWPTSLQTHTKFSETLRPWYTGDRLPLRWKIKWWAGWLMTTELKKCLPKGRAWTPKFVREKDFPWSTVG